MNNIANMYVHGQGVLKDKAMAQKWFAKIRNTDYPSLNIGTQFNLGQMYADGTIVPKDLGKATALLHNAALQGHAFAQNNLGLMYKEGLGVPQSDTIAMDYFMMAAKQGDFRARLNLSDMGILKRPSFTLPSIVFLVGLVAGLPLVFIRGGWIGYLIVFFGFLIAVVVRVIQASRWGNSWDEQVKGVRLIR
jgi:hypothetical protein